MLRLFTVLAIAPAVLMPARATELILTGISASGGPVRAFFSDRGGASTFSLQLHEEVAGIRFERINRKTQQVWIMESGEGRWLQLGSRQEQASPSVAPAFASGSERGVRTDSSTPWHSGASPGLSAPSITPGGAGAIDSGEMPEPALTGAVEADMTSATPHRWKPGVVRDPTAAELHRARNGSAALDAAVRRGELRRD